MELRRTLRELLNSNSPKNSEDNDLVYELLCGESIPGIEVMRQDGGAEHCEVVMKEESTGNLYMFYYTYYSHEGFEYDLDDEIIKVRPVEKTITVFEYE